MAPHIANPNYRPKKIRESTLRKEQKDEKKAVPKADDGEYVENKASEQKTPISANETMDMEGKEKEDMANKTSSRIDSKRKSNVVGEPQEIKRNSADIEAASQNSFSSKENSFSDIHIRHQFIRKVYGIVFMQLCFTMLTVILFSYTQSLQAFCSKYWWVGFVFSLMAVSILMALILGPVHIRRQYPGNIILLIAFTLLETLAVSIPTAGTSSASPKHAVLMAFGLTAIVAIFISAFALQTSLDFTHMGGVCFLLSGVVIFVSAMGILFYYVVDRETLELVHLICACVGALVACCFLIFDTQMLVRGKHHKFTVHPDDYVYGVVAVYLDILMLFVYIYNMFVFAGHQHK